MSNDQESRDESRDEGDAAAQTGENGAAGAGIEARLAAVEAERDEMKDRMLRIAAEFENWKKRARKEQEDAEAKVRDSMLRDVLDVVDNLERAVSAYGQGETKAGGAASVVDGAAILKGVGLVLRVAHSKLERHGVKAIEAHGRPFDPKFHEAISRVETHDYPAGNVAVELQRGYLIGDRLLRPAMVGVATAPAGKDGAKGARPGGAGGIGGGSEGGGPGERDGVSPEPAVGDDGA